MVACLDRGKKGESNCGKTRWDEHCPGSTGKFRPGALQRRRRRCSLCSIRESRLAGQEIIQSREKHGRAAIDGHINETMLLARLAPGVNQFRASLEMGALRRRDLCHSRSNQLVRRKMRGSTALRQVR